jgi:hypothetical protein
MSHLGVNTGKLLSTGREGKGGVTELYRGMQGQVNRALGGGQGGRGSSVGRDPEACSGLIFVLFCFLTQGLTM